MIDFRQHDQHQHHAKPADGPLEFDLDVDMAQRIRASLDARKDVEAFAEADKRMRRPA
jgi:hypothetical protein